MLSKWVEAFDFFDLSDSSYTSQFLKRTTVISHYLSLAHEKVKLPKQSHKSALKNLQYLQDHPSLPSLAESSPEEWEKSLNRFLEQLSSRKTLFLRHEDFYSKESIFSKIEKIFFSCAESKDFSVLKTRSTALCALIGFAVSTGSLCLLLKVCRLLLDDWENGVKSDLSAAECFFNMMERYKGELCLSLPYAEELNSREISTSGFLMLIFLF